MRFSGRVGLFAWAPAVFGATILALALPYAMTATLALPGNAARALLQDGGAVGEQAILRLEDSRRNMLAFLPTSAVYADLGYAEALRATRRDPDDPERAALLDAAMADLERGIALSPVDSYAWARLTYARMLAEGPGPRAAAAFRMSMLTGTFERGLYLIRAEYGLVLYPWLDADMRDLLLIQLRLAWRYYNADDVMRRALRVPYGPALLRQALGSSDPQAIGWFSTVWQRNFKR